MCKLCVHICKNGLVHLQTSIASLQTRLGILQMCFCCRISVWTFVLQMLFLRIRNFCVHLCKPWLVNLQYYIANLQNLVCIVCFAKLAMLALQTCQLSKYANFFFCKFANLAWQQLQALSASCETWFAVFQSSFFTCVDLAHMFTQNMLFCGVADLICVFCKLALRSCLCRNCERFFYKA